MRSFFLKFSSTKPYSSLGHLLFSRHIMQKKGYYNIAFVNSER